ncbi:hypothetical protein HID58_036025 [Brassica napus]|uniref:Uncharacterized protein n=1 Tax=Brassica napus TaxID=3708 RepID=A0ABQ8C6K4_BRANA|nr:hypothetical protein HID58_036025 [Brassica napus]
MYACSAPFHSFLLSPPSILHLDKSLDGAVDVIGSMELSAKILAKNKIHLNEISYNSATGSSNSGASIVAKRQSVDRVLVEETGENINRNLGSGLLDIPESNTNIVFGFPSLVRFSWGTCTNAFEGQC